MYCLDDLLEESIENFVFQINSNLENGKTKRLEEELKVVFKKSLKHLMNIQKEKMDNESRVILKKKNYTMGFYKHYFEQTHKDNPNFRNFFKIMDSQGEIDYSLLNTSLIHPLTVNATFLAKITLSEPFKNDLLTYLDFQILEDYKKVRLTKIKRILINFYDLAAKNPSYSAISDFTVNHQMKLPWATRDLERAVLSLKEAMEKPMS